MNPRKVCIKTVGCRTNKSDSSLIRELLDRRGYVITDQEDEAEIIIINSCVVTAKAERDTRRLIYRAKRKAPHAKVILTGCMAQVYPEEGVKTGAHLVIGLNERDKIWEFIDREGIFISQPDSLRAGGTFFEGTRAFLKIQEGCDHYCAYCIVPYARGKPRNLPSSEVIRIVKILEEKGYKEIVLCGTNLGKYRDNTIDLSVLMEKIIESTDRTRLRLSSIEPFYVDESLIKRVLEEKRVAKHLHIPLQSASDKVLKEMGRNYTFTWFKKLIDSIKERDKFICIGTDLIAGFPTETEADFRESVEKLRDLDVDYFHVFSYSPRKGTRAYNLKSPFSEKERKIRTKTIIEIGESKRINFIRKNIGREETVLIEKNSPAYSEGLTSNYIKVIINKPLARNEFYKIRIIGEKDGKGEGEIA